MKEDKQNMNLSKLNNKWIRLNKTNAKEYIHFLDHKIDDDVIKYLEILCQQEKDKNFVNNTIKIDNTRYIFQRNRLTSGYNIDSIMSYKVNPKVNEITSAISDQIQFIGNRVVSTILKYRNYYYDKDKTESLKYKFKNYSYFYEPYPINLVRIINSERFKKELISTVIQNMNES